MDAVTKLIDRWQAARAEVQAVEAAAHPDVTDAYDRVWTWTGRAETYSHCGAAAPKHMIPSFGFPTQSALDNPNYVLCDLCLDGRTRNVPDCRPEWKCSHPMHQADWMDPHGGTLDGTLDEPCGG